MIIGACVALTLYLGVVPLGFLLWQSFFTPQSAAKAAEFTLGNYREAYASEETWLLFWSSIRFATGASLLAFALGTALAWMNERTNTPFKSLFFALSLIPLIIPGILFTVAWILLGSPKIGLVNLALQKLFDTDAVFIDVYSIGGMIWVDALHYSPMAFLLMTAAFRAMDPALEESAVMSGASVLQVAWQGDAATGVAGDLRHAAHPLRARDRVLRGARAPRPAGRHPGVHLGDLPGGAPLPEPGRASLPPTRVTLLVITSAGVYFQSRLSTRGNRYATMTGKGFRPRQIDLGTWR